MKYPRLLRTAIGSMRLKAGFTLLELLLAISILTMLVVVLASGLNQALVIWERNEAKRDFRGRARAALAIIATELKQATLPIGDQDQLGLVINPPSISEDCKQRDALFFQAPIATDRSKGDLATVGYFVRKGNGGVPKLCRILINPSDSDYKATSSGMDWLNTALLDSKAPADDANLFKGLFFENVLGLWVTAETASGSSSDYDSRLKKALPRRVDVSLVFVDAALVGRLVGMGITFPAPVSYSTPKSYIDALPDKAKKHVEMVTISVPLAL